MAFWLQLLLASFKLFHLNLKRRVFIFNTIKFCNLLIGFLLDLCHFINHFIQFSSNSFILYVSVLSLNFENFYFVLQLVFRLTYCPFFFSVILASFWNFFQLTFENLEVNLVCSEITNFLGVLHWGWWSCNWFRGAFDLDRCSKLTLYSCWNPIFFIS